MKQVRSSIISKALKESLKSEHKYRIGAVIFNHKTIVSSGRNYTLKSVRSFTIRFIKYRGSVHAEVDAIINAKKDLKGCSMIIIRSGRSGNLLPSFPCKWCLGYIEHVGIKNIFYMNKEIKLMSYKIGGRSIDK
uniref:Putative CMP/dCMP deaminase zinc-binding n=1 Tax=viral metagenome TaxID=1070528 RepID=A0A6H1ZDQ1_9ZZZZ